MFDITFLRPHYLTYLALLVPVVLGLCYLSYTLRKRARAAYGEEKLVGRYTKPLARAGELLIAGAWTLVVTLLVWAAAGPVTSSLPATVQAGSLQVIAVVDVSKSMAAEDYRAVMPDKDGVEPHLVPGPYGGRLDYVKLVLRDQVMTAIIGNQLGIVTYSGNGFEQVPLTDDWTATRWVMANWMKVGNAPGGGSDYAEGLAKALEMFKRDYIEGRQKVILLFTDGGFTGDDKQLMEVVAKVQEEGIRMIIVGVGSTTAYPIPEYNAKGHLVGNYAQDGQVVLTQVDVAAIERLAAQTGAEYLLLDPDGNSKLDVKWASKLGATKTDSKEDPVFQYPLGIALILLVGLFMRGGFKRRKA